MENTDSTPSSPIAGLIFRRELRIEWGDCDPAGIVFYPRYLAFFDANTAYLFEAAGLPKAEMVKTYDIIGMPLVDVGAKFFMPSRFGDRVIVESNVAEWKRSSLTIEHRILRDGKLAVQGHESRVWAGKDPERPGGIKARAIPDEVIQRFAHADPA
ncbi:acyl-CoA thioesterase [Povalibacter sp.]|uniref:acyl-CoA thioesterase n=1 Tax=Povalibacter sp. TaxID=1962978 RepID=UPI002F4191A3